jgi:predicted DNA-binding protein with PD1-like motif
MFELSRRACFGTMLCACVAAEGLSSASAVALPSNYMSATKLPEPGKAPGLRVRMIAGEGGGPRSWALIFAKGDKVMSGLLGWAEREKIAGVHPTATGALSSALFGRFDVQQRAYRNIRIDDQVECISLIGDIGLVNDKPALHVHGCVGLPDGAVKGGHLLHATTFPALEMFATEAAVPLPKQENPETSLELFGL